MKPSTRMSAAAMRVTDVTDEPAPGPRAAFKRINNCTSVTSCHSHANVLVHEQQESCRRNITNNARGPSRAMQEHEQAMRVQAVIRRMLAVRSEECPQVEHPLAIRCHCGRQEGEGLQGRRQAPASGEEGLSHIACCPGLSQSTCALQWPARQHERAVLHDRAMAVDDRAIEP